MKRSFLDLGRQPLANNFKKKKNKSFYNLKLFFDTKTKLVSINKSFDKKMMFNKTYPYRSSLSLTIKKHYRDLSIKLKKNIRFKNILEIGSNDGAFARNFDKKKIICVEPCLEVGNELKKKKFKVFIEYFDNKLTKKLKLKYQKFDLIFSANTITHIANLREVLKNISNLLSEDGVFVLEEPSFLECLKKNAFDQFYNEHLYVLSLISLKNILRTTNLKIFKIENINVHGGSLRYYIAHKENNKFKISKNLTNQLKTEINAGLNKFTTYKDFAKNVRRAKKDLIKIFRDIKQKNGKIVGYGASAKSVTVLNYCNLKEDFFEYFLDTTKNKINKYLPGTGILVKKYQKEILDKYTYYFLGAWNFKKEIFKKEKQIIEKGAKFILHLPAPHIYKK
jgi:methylation protein EvaC